MWLISQNVILVSGLWSCWRSAWWVCCSYSLVFCLLAQLSHVNLNNIMCPAVSDPFHSRWYRIAAAGHQTLLILFHGKAFVYLCSVLSSETSQVSSDGASALGAIQPDSEARSDVRVEHSNGYVKTHVANGKPQVTAFGEPMLATMNMNGFAKLD